jgi:hypothetical protein
MDLPKATRDELIREANKLRRGAVSDSKNAFSIAKKLAALQCMDHARRRTAHLRDGAALSWQWFSAEGRSGSKNPDGPGSKRTMTRSTSRLDQERSRRRVTE